MTMAAGSCFDPSRWLAIFISWQCLCWLTTTAGLIDRGGRSQPTGKKEMFVIDVDAGSDDALAIMLMASKLASTEARVELIAITCVNGNTHLDDVVVNVLKTLKTIGRLDIPVYRGSAQSILHTPATDNFFGKDGFGDFYYEGAPEPEEYIQKEHAVSALVRIVSQHPGKVNLLAVGPLTNVALAVRLHPGFIKDLKSLYVLGGAVNGVGNVKPGVEFNFYMDPIAVEIVLNTTNKPVCLIPWETAKIHSTISMSWRKKVLGEMDSPQVKMLNLAERISGKSDNGQWICSDAWAAMTALTTVKSKKKARSTCDGKPMFANVVWSRGDAAGVLLVDYANNTGMAANIEIVEKIDVLAFKDTLIRYLC